MAYKQNNNPFKKLHGDLQGFGERHAAWKAKREAIPQKKYGHFSESAKAYRADKKAGESKFQYDNRMRKEGRRSTTSSPESKMEGRFTTTSNILSGGAGTQAPLDVEGADTPSWEWKTQKRNPGDLREQSRTTDIHLPSAPGDKWRYEWDQYDPETVYLRAWDKDGNLHNVVPGSEADKAIRKRYTGSETGDLSSWYGHDTRESTFTWDETMGDEWIEGDTYTEKKSYLPYDLAQKHYNPKYKGSKK